MIYFAVVWWSQFCKRSIIRRSDLFITGLCLLLSEQRSGEMLGIQRIWRGDLYRFFGFFVFVAQIVLCAWRIDDVCAFWWHFYFLVLWFRANLWLVVGQLGDGTYSSRSTNQNAVGVSGLDSGVQSIAAGKVHSCVMCSCLGHFYLKNWRTVILLYIVRYMAMLIKAMGCHEGVEIGEGVFKKGSCDLCFLKFFFMFCSFPTGAAAEDRIVWVDSDTFVAGSQLRPSHQRDSILLGKKQFGSNGGSSRAIRSRQIWKWYIQEWCACSSVRIDRQQWSGFGCARRSMLFFAICDAIFRNACCCVGYFCFFGIWNLIEGNWYLVGRVGEFSHLLNAFFRITPVHFWEKERWNAGDQAAEWCCLFHLLIELCWPVEIDCVGAYDVLMCRASFITMAVSFLGA